MCKDRTLAKALVFYPSYMSEKALFCLAKDVNNSSSMIIKIEISLVFIYVQVLKRTVNISTVDERVKSILEV